MLGIDCDQIKQGLRVDHLFIFVSMYYSGLATTSTNSYLIHLVFLSNDVL